MWPRRIETEIIAGGTLAREKGETNHIVIGLSHDGGLTARGYLFGAVQGNGSRFYGSSAAVDSCDGCAMAPRLGLLRDPFYFMSERMSYLAVLFPTFQLRSSLD